MLAQWGDGSDRYHIIPTPHITFEAFHRLRLRLGARLDLTTTMSSVFIMEDVLEVYQHWHLIKKNEESSFLHNVTHVYSLSKTWGHWAVLDEWDQSWTQNALQIPRSPISSKFKKVSNFPSRGWIKILNSVQFKSSHVSHILDKMGGTNEKASTERYQYLERAFMSWRCFQMTSDATRLEITAVLVFWPQ